MVCRLFSDFYSLQDMHISEERSFHLLGMKLNVIFINQEKVRCLYVMCNGAIKGIILLFDLTYQDKKTTNITDSWSITTTSNAKC